MRIHGVPGSAGTPQTLPPKFYVNVISNIYSFIIVVLFFKILFYLAACYSNALLMSIINIERDLANDFVSEEILKTFVNIDRKLCLKL